MTTRGGLPEIPRFGMQTALRREYDHLTWHGKGPHETYWDRQDARVGVYSGKAADQLYPYVKAQESGNKEGVRWLALTNSSGAGVLAVGEPTLSVNALPHTTEDLTVETHKENVYPYQLPKRDFVVLNLDARQRGLGGDNSWGALPHAAFRLESGRPLKYAYRLKVLHGGEDLRVLGRQKVE